MGKNILLCVDAQHYSPEATQMAQELCDSPEDTITILHVHEFAIGRFGKLQVCCPEDEADRLVSDIRGSLGETGISVEAKIREAHVGNIARKITDVADEDDARIIVLGSARSTDLPHLPFGSVSLKVLHLAKRPVIVVPKRAVGAVEEAAEGVGYGAAEGVGHVAAASAT